MRKGDTADADEAVYSKTLDELARGDCKGPFSPNDLDRFFPDGWLGVRRFGVAQIEDYRPVDDFPIFG